MKQIEADNLARLKALFPDLVTEGPDGTLASVTRHSRPQATRQC